MDINIERSWQREVAEEFEKPYFKSLMTFVKDEYASHSCFPPAKQIFAAFDHCPFDRVKVVILGQDPYHGEGQANGLCFSVPDGIKHPPSLMNIFKEIEADLGQKPKVSGNLEPWAAQGVFLLNATLTVRAHEAGSHQNRGWEEFTNKVIEVLSNRSKPIIFLLWGGFAKQKVKQIDTKKHHVLTSGHPSPLSANRGYWFGNSHFSKANSLLRAHGMSEIQW